MAATNPERELDREDHRAIDDIYANRETHPPRISIANGSGASGHRHGKDASTTLIPSDEETLAEIESDQRLRLVARDNPIELSFIYHAKYGDFNLPMGSTLFGARSGRGKSATAANILAEVIRKYPNKNSLVLTNEETTEGVFNRVACAYLGKSYSLLQLGKLPESDIQEIESCIKGTLVNRIKVCQRITTLEGAIAVFDEAAAHRKPPFDLIIVDFLQNIKLSAEHLEMKSWDVSKQFGDYLTEFGTRYITRVVIFSQLNRNSEGQDFQDRIHNDKTFLAHMKVGIEIIPNFETSMTEFIVHKNRDGTWHVGATAGAQFDESRFKYDAINKTMRIKSSSHSKDVEHLNRDDLNRSGASDFFGTDSSPPSLGDDRQQCEEDGEVPF